MILANVYLIRIDLHPEKKSFKSAIKKDNLVEKMAASTGISPEKIYWHTWLLNF